MFYEKELRFLRDTFKKNHITTAVVTPNDYLSAAIDTSLDDVFGYLEPNATVHSFTGKLEERTVYKTSDALELCYRYLLLPASPKAHILFIGPYLSEPITSRRLLELCERNGIPPSNQRYLKEYLSSIPVLADGASLIIMLDTFCELIWNSDSFAIADLKRERTQPASPINQPSHRDDFDEVLVNMKAMEKRYEFENELMRAVSLGQTHKENSLIAAFSDELFEKRVSDPLRNAKNYGIIMNTLLRKAAENGGVHPVYLDRISSEFATKIEQMHSLSENHALMREMFRSYCRLVRKHSMKNFSLVVQKAILLIDSDLSADLTLHSLAKHQNVSAGYLSTVFKKETGKTVSQYIRDKRIQHASHLLDTTRLQVQTVALYCGIMDVQYFSKLFKKHTGMTPKEYRDSKK